MSHQMNNPYERQQIQYRHWRQILGDWPEEQPILALVSDHWFIIAFEMQEVSWDRFLTDKWPADQPLEVDLPFVGGYMGVVSYDTYGSPSADATEHPPRVYQVAGFFIGHVQQQKLYQFGRLPHSFHAYANRSFQPGPQQQQLGFTLWPTEADQQFLQKLHRCQELIREGKFYQINLIRYFEVQQQLTRPEVLAKLSHAFEPYSSIFDFDDYSLVSFSPECFTQSSYTPLGWELHTFPIKGTVIKQPSLGTEQQQVELLAGDIKERAELSMIVDLMRNDLNRVSQPCTVKVPYDFRVKSFKSVYHLQGMVRGLLRKNQTIGEIFSCLLPAGSITGAPKIEVMATIAQLEAQQRGYFMGNVFYLDRLGQFNSSVLIRTMVGGQKSRDNSRSYQYAAGSGITLKSNLQRELDEITGKCRVMTEGRNFGS